MCNRIRFSCSNFLILLRVIFDKIHFLNFNFIDNERLSLVLEISIITIGPNRHIASSQGETQRNNNHNNSINVLPYDNIQPVTGRPCFAYDIIVHQLGQGEPH